MRHVYAHFPTTKRKMCLCVHFLKKFCLHIWTSNEFGEKTKETECEESRFFSLEKKKINFLKTQIQTQEKMENHINYIRFFAFKQPKNEL